MKKSVRANDAPYMTKAIQYSFKDLDINVPTDCLNDTINGIIDPIQAVIRKYDNYSSILKINERLDYGSTKFSFNKI